MKEYPRLREAAILAVVALALFPAPSIAGQVRRGPLPAPRIADGFYVADALRQTEVFADPKASHLAFHGRTSDLVHLLSRSTVMLPGGYARDPGVRISVLARGADPISGDVVVTRVYHFDYDTRTGTLVRRGARLATEAEAARFGLHADRIKSKEGA